MPSVGFEHEFPEIERPQTSRPPGSSGHFKYLYSFFLFYFYIRIVVCFFFSIIPESHFLTLLFAAAWRSLIVAHERPNHVGKARLRGGPAGQLPAAASYSYKGRYDVTGIIGNLLLVISNFHNRKNFSGNFPQFRHELSKSFAIAFLGWNIPRNGSACTRWIIGN